MLEILLAERGIYYSWHKCRGFGIGFCLDDDLGNDAQPTLIITLWRLSIIINF